jgi:hypothetical protein
LIYDLTDYLQHHCSGKPNAIKRDDLLRVVRGWGYAIGDRDLREAIKTIHAVCMCNRGYYIGRTKEETDEAIEYLKKKIFPLWKDIENIQAAYPEFYPKGYQLELFI